MADATPEDVARVQAIFQEALNIAAPDPDLDIIEAALLDSLGLIALLFEIEQQFGIEIPLESLEIEDIRSVSSIAGLLRQSAR
jgi:D-alanine--poly(phosphoribitol) ligase subunit 2